MTFDEIAKQDGVKAAKVADAARIRRNVVSKLFDMVGKTCKDEASRGETVRQLRALAEQGSITADELAEYEASVTVRADDLAPKAAQPLSGRARQAVDAVKGTTEVDKMTDAEFRAAWEKL